MFTTGGDPAVSLQKGRHRLQGRRPTRRRQRENSYELKGLDRRAELDPLHRGRDLRDHRSAMTANHPCRRAAQPRRRTRRSGHRYAFHNDLGSSHAPPAGGGHRPRDGARHHGRVDHLRRVDDQLHERELAQLEPESRASSPRRSIAEGGISAADVDHQQGFERVPTRRSSAARRQPRRRRQRAALHRYLGCRLPGGTADRAPGCTHTELENHGYLGDHGQTGGRRNPTRHEASLTKTMTASHDDHTAAASQTTSPVWNYVYSTAPQGAGCEVDITGDERGGRHRRSYVTGDLCLSGTNAQIIENKANGGQAVDVRSQRHA